MSLDEITIEVTLAEVTVAENVDQEVVVVMTGNTGPPGEKGDKGDKGDPGDPGGAGLDLTYTHVQMTPAATWVIVHNMGKHPTVTVVDSGESVIIPDVQYDNVNQVSVFFGSATSGKAYLN